MFGWSGYIRGPLIADLNRSWLASLLNDVLQKKLVICLLLEIHWRLWIEDEDGVMGEVYLAIDLAGRQSCCEPRNFHGGSSPCYK
jgi:hypothetical protein